jgi:hypothetical protein
MTTNLMLVGSVVVLILTSSIFGFLKHRHKADVVQLFGSAFLLVMVLTHVAEHFHLLMTMRWGSPDSPAILSNFQRPAAESEQVHWIVR